MAANIYREYKFKFYLNANHYIYIEGKAGQLHPHTWEFEISILCGHEKFVEFAFYEKIVDTYLEKYQNKIINELEPFDRIMPTLENITEHFAEDLRGQIQRAGGELIMLECSETPTRRYVVGFQDDLRFIHKMEKNSKERMNEIISGLVEEIAK